MGLVARAVAPSENGRDVIVKVRRPGIEQQVEVDLALLRRTASLLERRSERAC